MYRDDRPEDQTFEPNELLYRRCCFRDIEEGRLLPARIDFPDWSVNRQKFSLPEDVRFPSGQDLEYFCCGVAVFKVSDIIEKINSPKDDGNAVFEFRVSHVPENDNYAHSELLTFKDNINGKGIKNFKKKINLTVKKLFRTYLGDRIQICIYPTSDICIK